MHAQSFTIKSFLLRLLFAFMLVFLTYNPTGLSYYHWFSFKDFSPLLGIAGISLIIGWVVYIRATLRSLGTIGLILAALFFASLIWLFVDLGWIGVKSMTAFSWVSLFILTFVLAVGISWSHIRRKLSGQVDSDDVDQE